MTSKAVELDIEGCASAFGVETKHQLEAMTDVTKAEFNNAISNLTDRAIKLSSDGKLDRLELFSSAMQGFMVMSTRAVVQVSIALIDQLEGTPVDKLDTLDDLITKMVDSHRNVILDTINAELDRLEPEK